MIGMIIMIGNKRAVILLAFSLASFTAPFFIPMYTGAVNTADEVRCDACHILEHDEFSRTVVHNTIKCTSCHTISEFAPDLYSHSATTFSCIYCHAEQNASRFNSDAHNNFSNASNATDIFTDNSEMCVACHTNIELEVEWHSYTGMNITSTVNLNGTWELYFHSIYGENVTTNYTNKT